MNPSKRHQPMAMRVLSGTPAVCMVMALLERRECTPTSSGENPILVNPTCQVLALMKEMMSEELTERIPQAVG